MDNAEKWFRRGLELADQGGPVADEGLHLLREAVAAGHGPARVSLAVFLLGRHGDADSRAEALRLLDEAVARDVPGARNMLGVTFWDEGALDDAEDCLRAAVADGDPDAPVNLAGVLHAQGDDAAAFAVLRAAAERGDGRAYWIVMRLLPPRCRAAREVTSAYESASYPVDRPVCVLVPTDAWQLDASALPVE